MTAINSDAAFGQDTDDFGEEQPPIQFLTPDDPISLVHKLKQEAHSTRRKFEQQWSINKQLDIGNQWDHDAPDDRVHLVLNNISRQIDGIVATMLESRPRITFKSSRAGGKSMLYIKPEFGQALFTRLMIGAKKGPDKGKPIALNNLLDPEAPIETQNVIFGAKPAAEETLAPYMDRGLITEDNVHRINDTTQAEFLKNGLMGVWDWYKWDWLIAEQWRAALVVGHRDLMVYYDEDKEDPQLWPILEKDSWIDPNPCCTDIDTAGYYICAQVMSVEKAVAMAGDDEEKAALIRKNTEDPSGAVTSDGESLSDKYSEIDWQREMSVLYTAWIRDEVVLEQTPDGPITRRVLRQIRFVANVLLEDGISPFPDIPVVRFKNVPITDSAYSIGEPEVMKDVQQLWNRVHSNFHDDIRMHVAPQMFCATPIMKHLQDRNAYSRANRIIPIPAALLDMSRHKPVEFVVPPGLNPSHMAYAGFLQQIMNEQGLQSDVLRGQGAASQSGAAIGLLQSAGRGVIAMRSFWFEKPVARLAELCRWMMINWMPPEKWLEYSEQYPPHILEDVLLRASKARFSTVAVVDAGRAQRKEVEQQKAMALRGAGDLSFDTLIEKMDMGDPSEEKKKIIDEQLETSKLAAQLQQEASLQAGGDDVTNTEE